MFPADAKRGGQLHVQEITGAKWGTSYRPEYVSVAAKSKEQQPPSFVCSRRLPQAVTPAFILVFFFQFFCTTSVIGHTLQSVMKFIRTKSYSFLRLRRITKLSCLSYFMSCELFFLFSACWSGGLGISFGGAGLVDMNRVRDDGTERLS